MEVSLINKSSKIEREMNILKRKIQEISKENATLKEINIKFQLENYNLQKKIRQLEGSQQSRIENYQKEDYSLDEEIDEDSEEIDQPKEFYEIVDEEYLEDVTETAHETYSEPPSKKPKTNFEIQITESGSKEEEEEFIVRIETETKGEDSDGVDCNEDSVKEAMVEICKLAATRGTLEKIKSIHPGKQKDSAFVSKILELVFDKHTLASSSAHGQRCQRDLSSAPKPALDATKLDLCKRAFIFRVRTDESSSQLQKARLKHFYKLVNDKIQNVRKCLNRNEPMKLDE